MLQQLRVLLDVQHGRATGGEQAVLQGAIPAWLENEAPVTISRSASFISQLATGVPLRPSTPAPSGWVSGISSMRDASPAMPLSRPAVNHSVHDTGPGVTPFAQKVR